MIFEEKQRTRTEPKKPGEDEFAFYDFITGAAYDLAALPIIALQFLYTDR